MAEKIKILDKEYEVSALRIKYLRRINEVLKEPPSTSITTLLDRYSPYIVASIEAFHPGFDKALLDELSFEEFLDAWKLVLQVSGIVVQPISGETKPSTTLTGQGSTEDSASPLAGTTVQ